ncbi:alpha/beta fold hydrolase [Phytoactinopolyspora halotolerans]|uniref:Alpha/beta hydrolase n=1 Tax=Phytoactinopolyspora halotolerans TaxID=1981512 RepID=A0A6L9S980_9ACTN|nr:alpha/beta hydrolase [Phytoactinopolyspora halotolerans]NEE01251.1 alpha/beta hydrolase [Phytoactinopolyspora halotolerans]
MVADTLTFDAADGTRLAYRRIGTGKPLVCIPGGPMLPSAELADLGGLSAYRTLILLDLRGTGDSAAPADPSTYRCDRLVDDVEALRTHLALDRIDLLAHSAGASLALLYATRYPERIDHLALITPSARPVRLEISDDDRRQVAELRRDEAWFPDAYAALERIQSGSATETDWSAIMPFTYGSWDQVAQAHAARADEQRNVEAAGIYYSDGALDPESTTASLADLQAPVLVVAGEYDVALPAHRAADYARLFAHADVAVLPQAGHQPWLDDPGRFAQTVNAFLD